MASWHFSSLELLILSFAHLIVQLYPSLRKPKPKPKPVTFQSQVAEIAEASGREQDFHLLTAQDFFWLSFT